MINRWAAGLAVWIFLAIWIFVAMTFSVSISAVSAQSVWAAYARNTTSNTLEPKFLAIRPVVLSPCKSMLLLCEGRLKANGIKLRKKPYT
jgi:hypothetical protein